MQLVFCVCAKTYPVGALRSLVALRRKSPMCMQAVVGSLRVRSPFRLLSHRREQCHDCGRATCARGSSVDGDPVAIGRHAFRARRIVPSGLARCGSVPSSWARSASIKCSAHPCGHFLANADSGRMCRDYRGIRNRAILRQTIPSRRHRLLFIDVRRLHHDHRTGKRAPPPARDMANRVARRCVAEPAVGSRVRPNSPPDLRGPLGVGPPERLVA